MKYKVVRIADAYEAVRNNTIKNQRGTYVEIDELINELQTIHSRIVVAVDPNCLDLTINDISNYLDKRENSFVATLTDVAAAIRISRPTLNEWRNAGIIDIKQRRPKTIEEKNILKQKNYKKTFGYDISELLKQLKTYRTLQKTSKQ